MITCLGSVIEYDYVAFLRQFSDLTWTKHRRHFGFPTNASVYANASDKDIGKASISANYTTRMFNVVLTYINFTVQMQLHS